MLPMQLCPAVLWTYLKHRKRQPHEDMYIRDAIFLDYSEKKKAQSK